MSISRPPAPRRRRITVSALVAGLSTLAFSLPGTANAVPLSLEQLQQIFADLANSAGIGARAGSDPFVEREGARDVADSLTEHD